MLRTGIGLLAMVALTGAGWAAELTLEKPENDKLTMAATIEVAGRGSPDGTPVRITANGSTTTTSVSGGKWSVNGLNLNVGANTIRIQLGDKTASVLVVRGADDVKSRPPQEVRFVWNAGVDDQLKQLARESLSTPLSNEQLTNFVAAVKTRTVEIFKERYRGVADIRVVDSDGNDVHTISMLRADDDVFGQSPFDCGNKRAREVSEVHVGTYRSQMTQPDQFGFIDGWEPMRRSDSVAVRIEDVSQALGRTSSHEFGHSLGMTGGAGDFACVWMDGCDGGHNCDGFDARNTPLANRFDDGWHIMDPGGKTRNNARLAEPETDSRAAQRRAPVFDTFAASYLRLIQPLP